MIFDKQRCYTFVLMMVLLVQAAWAQTHSDNVAFDHQHSVFNTLLNRFVENGFVDYKGLRAESAELKEYQQSLAAVSTSDYSNWGESQQIVFWINAYNAFTLQAILDNYPIKRSGAVKGLFGPSNSILQIPGVWKELEWQAAGLTVTLDQIEHEILRAQFNEPRIHFAIVCASISCPDLRSEAFVADRVDEQLSEQLGAFIVDNTKGVEINIRRKRVNLSKIFDWFGEDFDVPENNNALFTKQSKSKAAVLRYIKRYLPAGEELNFLNNEDFRVSYLDYDWNLNEQAKD